MGKAIYCPFPRCKNETAVMCSMHKAIAPALEATYYLEPRPETLNYWITQLAPIVEAMEEMWRERYRAEKAAEYSVKKLREAFGEP